MSLRPWVLTIGKFTADLLAPFARSPCVVVPDRSMYSTPMRWLTTRRGASSLIGRAVLALVVLTALIPSVQWQQLGSVIAHADHHETVTIEGRCSSSFSNLTPSPAAKKIFSCQAISPPSTMGDLSLSGQPSRHEDPFAGWVPGTQTRPRAPPTLTL